MQLRNWHSLARRWSGWLLAALLLATLAPGISRALSAAPGGHWVELCTSQGMEWVQVDAVSPDAGVADPDPLDRCGHCTLATERFAPLIPDLPVLPAVLGHWPVPAFAAIGGIAISARTPLARGPPFLG